MPYAIIKTGGKQYRVEPGRTYRIPTLVGDAGSDIEFNEVLFGSERGGCYLKWPKIFGRRRCSGS